MSSDLAPLLEAIRSDVREQGAETQRRLAQLQEEIKTLTLGLANVHRDHAVLGERVESERQRAVEAAKSIRENAQRLAYIEAANNRTEGALKATKVLSGMGIAAGGGSLIERLFAFLSMGGGS